MAMKRKKIKLRYKIERVLFSDILPYELPFIFSNRYFYRFLISNRIRIENDEIRFENNEIGVLPILAFLFGKNTSDLINNKKINIKKIDEINKLKRIPFTYRILHKPNKYRELAIINPVNQIQMVHFYQQYSSLMLYYTNLDRFSLRHPSKVACFFYYKDKLHHELLGRKTDKVELFFNEYENLRSFFSYKRYNNIYKFYEDYRYQRAEKKFLYLYKFDIQSCFDSIYTHSIAWATGGGRDFYKQNFCGNDNTFASKWDKLMELMNYNETNGIVIGPEFSRIFAEVILQYIDKQVESDLQKEGYNYNKDYVCYRYVDDFFLFFNKKEVQEKAMMLFTNQLKEFKLSINSEKTVLMERPFITDITIAKDKIDSLIDDMLSYQVKNGAMDLEKKEDDENNTENDENDDNKQSIEDILKNKDSFKFINANEFNAQYKAILKTTNVESKDVVNYTMARICRKMEQNLKKFEKIFKEICKFLSDNMYEDRHLELTKQKNKKEEMLRKHLLAVLDVIFFIYSNNKRVNTTLKVINILNDIIILLDNDYIINDIKIKRYSDMLRDVVFKKIQDEISLIFQNSEIDENTQIETLYFFVIMRNMRSKYHLSSSEIEKYLKIKREGGRIISYPSLNALSIIILLYYFGKEDKYKNVKNDLMDYVIKKYKGVPKNVRGITTEFTILTLDLISCPYINEDQKKKIANLMGIQIADFHDMLVYFKKHNYMFTHWYHVNITKEINAKISQEVYS